MNPKVSNHLLNTHDGGTCILVKDDNSKKRATLLSHSLTQADGADWSRQRPAVVAAIGGGITVQTTRHKQAAIQGSIEALKLIDMDDDMDDVMDFALRVAARGIVTAITGGTEDVIQKTRELEETLVSFQKSSRKNQNLDVKLVASLQSNLKHIVDEIVEHYAQKISSGVGGDECTALVFRLLQQETLSRQEATANTNSCLLAGVETTSLLIGTALLRLASRPAVRSAARDEIIGTSSERSRQSRLVRAIMTETLRIHPPVMGLPRKVAAPEGLQLPCGTHLPVGTCFSVCLLSAAVRTTITPPTTAAETTTGALTPPPPTATPITTETAAETAAEATPVIPAAATSSPPSSTAPAASDSSWWQWVRERLFGHRNDAAAFARRRAESLRATSATWAWDVDVDMPNSLPLSSSSAAAADGKKLSTGCPFGMGKRSCPAGALSLVVAREVLEALLVHCDWEFADPYQSDTEEWVQELTSAPTLVVKSPALRWTALRPLSAPVTEQSS